MIHGVAQFDDKSVAGSFMEEFAAFAQRCQSVVEDGVTTTIGPLSFPALGDESQAYRMEIDDPEAGPVALNLLVVRSGERASFVAVIAAFGSPDAALSEELAGVAAERL